MEEFAFATRTTPDSYEIFYFKDIESLFAKAKAMAVFPVRASFDTYLKEAFLDPKGIVVKSAPGSEDDPFDVILGVSRGVVEQVMGDHLAFLDKKVESKEKANQMAIKLLSDVAEGKISLERLAALMGRMQSGG